MSKQKIFTNSEIVILLRNVAAALLIKAVNRFRIIAYEKAADSIEHLTSELKDIWDEGKLEEVPGIGPTIAGHLDELFRTSTVKHFGKVFHGLSPALFPLLLVPGVGPKKAFRLTQEFKLTNAKTVIADLKKLCQQHKIAKLKGFGEKSEQVVLSGIETFETGQIKENRMPLPFADRLAQEVIDYLEKHPAVERVDALGSLRRKVATIGDIDLAAATEKPKEVVLYFCKYPKSSKIIDQGEKGATILLSIGRQVDLRVQSKKSYGAMLQYFTGSKHHNIKLREFALKKGLSLSEHGIKTLKKVKNSELTIKNFNKEKQLHEFESEKTFYGALGLPEIPPELREDAGEIEAALQHQLPSLITLKDIKGDLHVHTKWSDGNNSIMEMAQAAKKLGFGYICITDHTGQLKIANALDEKRIKKQREEINKVTNKSDNFKILQGTEVNIKDDGSLDMKNDVLKEFDIVLAAIHSGFKNSKEKITQRLIKAMENEHIDIIAHPFGRLINERPAYEMDFDKVLEKASQTNTILEINAYPDRLDLNDVNVRAAIKACIKLSIGTDAHEASELRYYELGIATARRGWAEKKDIINTYSVKEMLSLLK